jgi:hypothetical protein
MKKRTFVIYTGYIWTKTLLGLTFHPYKSVKDTLQRPILVPVLFSPLIMVILLFVVAKIGSFMILVYGFTRGLVALFLSTTLLAILLWQTLLVYLLCNFLISSWKKNK